MPLVAVGDLRMYYEIRGVGQRVLGIGGTGGDLRRSPTVFEMLPASGFEILAYDQRGLGQTSRPDQPYTMANYADDAAALVEELSWERCSVVGFSFGGMVAQELALRHPHRVARLILVSTSSGGEGGASFPLHKLATLPLDAYIRRIISLSDTRRDTAWHLLSAAQTRHPPVRCVYPPDNLP
jgi:3-oxoadipate enol-lactonase